MTCVNCGATNGSVGSHDYRGNSCKYCGKQKVVLNIVTPIPFVVESLSYSGSCKVTISDLEIKYDGTNAAVQALITVNKLSYNYIVRVGCEIIDSNGITVYSDSSSIIFYTVLTEGATYKYDKTLFLHSVDLDEGEYTVKLIY